MVALPTIGITMSKESVSAQSVRYPTVMKPIIAQELIMPSEKACPSDKSENQNRSKVISSISNNDHTGRGRRERKEKGKRGRREKGKIGRSNRGRTGRKKKERRGRGRGLIERGRKENEKRRNKKRGRGKNGTNKFRREEKHWS
jgi:hypothetical protein